MNLCLHIILWKRRTLAHWTEAVKAMRQVRPEPNADTATWPWVVSSMSGPKSNMD